MIGDPNDPDYNPDRFLIDLPIHAEIVITCDCGATVECLHLFNRCHICGASWDRWGHRVFGGRSQEPPAKP